MRRFLSREKLRVPSFDEWRRATCFLLVGIVLFSGYGTLAPAALRCHLPGRVECPGGVLGPDVAAASPGTQWFQVIAYDYSFWITNTQTGANDTSTWNMYEGWKAHINTTSYPANPNVGGVNEHGIGIYSNSQGSLLSLAAPVGSWASGSFTVPSTAETGDQIYCTIYCGPGHSSQYLNNINIEPAPPQPSVSSTATPTSGTAPLSVAFTATPSGGTSPYTYAWTFGDGNTATSQNPSHTYSTAGTFTATVKLTDSQGMVASSSQSITVNPPATLSATASASPTSGTAPLSVAFTGTASGGATPYAYAWSFGDGLTGTGATVAHTYTGAGNPVATLTVTDGAGTTATSSVPITVTAAVPLSVSASADKTSGNAWLHVNFSASATGGSGTYSAAWNFGDGQTGTGMTTSHIYTVAGSYTPQVTVTDISGKSGTATTSTIGVTGGQTAPLKVNAVVSPLNGTAPLTVNASSSVSGGSGGYVYTWGFGDGSPGSHSPAPQHVYNSSGTFPVSLSVQDSAGHVATAFANVTATAPQGLTASIVLNRTGGDLPLSVQATASIPSGAPPYTTSWDFGDGTTGSGTMADHIFTRAGTFTITLAVTDSKGAHTSSSASVVVNPPLTASLGASVSTTSYAVNYTLTVLGGSGHYELPFVWSFTDGTGTQTNLSGTSATHVFSGAGPVSATVKVVDSLSRAILVSNTTTLPTISSPSPTGGSIPGASLGQPWQPGIGDANATGLGLLGLMALGTLFLIATSPKRKVKAKAGHSQSSSATVGTGLVVGATAAPAGPSSATGPTPAEVAEAEAIAAAFSPTDESKEARIARAKAKAIKAKAERAAKAAASPTAGEPPSGTSGVPGPIAVSPEVVAAEAAAAAYAPGDTSKEAKIARAKLAAAKAREARAAKSASSSPSPAAGASGGLLPPLPPLPPPPPSPVTSTPSCVPPPDGGWARPSPPFPPPPAPLPPPPPTLGMGTASRAGFASTTGAALGRSGTSASGATWALRAPIARLPPPSTWTKGEKREGAPPSSASQSGASATPPP
ncbi:MAG: PKD domain-containing protein [Euryarchaeota archaeon]|nr:PKD domain-containing protein [Euryarchaeota archaeon]MDE1836880.1 PKD domain-containing protein [Euryarchaeota archaeon]MDE1881358.1 PKD domain-containing protein [Euryarchaeota archaeon]MDE2045283.1 PKD domain-containing protein [Thermoplasmata archaeon]